MAALTIKCAECDTEGRISLLEPDYKGLYTCWKCQAPFSIEVEGGQLKSCHPIPREEYQRQQEIEAMKAKFMKRPSS